MTNTQIDIEDLIAAVAAKRGPSLPEAELDALVARHAEARVQRRRDIEDRLANRRPIPSGLAEALLRGREQATTTVRSMSDVARRAYNREKAALSRARRKPCGRPGRTQFARLRCVTASPTPRSPSSEPEVQPPKPSSPNSRRRFLMRLAFR